MIRSTMNKAVVSVFALALVGCSTIPARNSPIRPHHTTVHVKRTSATGQADSELGRRFAAALDAAMADLMKRSGVVRVVSRDALSSGDYEISVVLIECDQSAPLKRGSGGDRLRGFELTTNGAVLIAQHGSVSPLVAIPFPNTRHLGERLDGDGPEGKIARGTRKLLEIHAMKIAVELALKVGLVTASSVNETHR